MRDMPRSRRRIQSGHEEILVDANANAVAEIINEKSPETSQIFVSLSSETINPKSFNNPAQRQIDIV